MGIHHTAFNCKLIIFFTFIIFLTFTTLEKAVAQNEVFVVDNVLVDITANDSVTAQNEAYAQAQGLAFEKLKRRLVDDSQLENFINPGFQAIENFVQDYEITNEKISSVRYVGTYRFRFRPEVVQKYFSGAGVSYTTQSSKPLLILPIFQRHGVNMLWSDYNLWMRAWSHSRISGGLVPVEVPMGDLSDISDIDDRDPLRYERRKLDNMLARYGATEAAIMIAVPDAALLSVENDQDMAIGRLRIIIYRTDRANAEYVGEFTLTAEMQETRASLYTRAVQRAYGALQRDWKKHHAASSSDNAQYTAHIPVQNLMQWVDLKAKLMNVPALSNFHEDVLNRTQITVGFNYRGDYNLLAQALKRAGFIISAPQLIQSGAEQTAQSYVVNLYTQDTLPEDQALPQEYQGFYRPPEREF